MGVSFSWAPFGQRLSVVNWEELSLGHKQDSLMDRFSNLRELIQKDIEKIKELGKASVRSIFTTIDNWIHSHKVGCMTSFNKYVEDCFENVKVCRLAYETSRSS